MTAVYPLNNGSSEVIEMSDNNGKQELIEADNDDDNDYVDNDDNDPEQPKEELKKKIPTVKKKINEDSVREYIKQNIKQRICDFIIPAAGKNDKKPTLCQCGLELSIHHEVSSQKPAISSSQENNGEQAYEGQVQVTSTNIVTKIVQQSLQQQRWDPDSHTTQSDPDSYGTIFFDGFGQEASRKAPYVRLDNNTPVDAIWTLLEKHWHLDPPKLIISVTGGAKRLTMKPRLLSTFKRGLINSVTASDAWIITGGTKAGVMEIVGETILDYMLQTGGTEKRITALGIASWGFVANKQVLVSDDSDGLFPAKYKLKDLNPGSTSLDPFHSHFILVDNGTDNKPGVEIKLRVELEAAIAKKCDAQLVLIVLEGGFQTLKTTAEAIMQGTPVVVIKGSGRAADFIAYAFYKHKSYEKKLPSEDEEKKFYEELRKKAEKSFDWSKEKNPKKIAEIIAVCIADVKKIMEHKKLLMVFHLEDNDTTSEIDQAILKVLLSARENTQSQVELALAWNCIEVARTDIFSMEARLSWQKVDLGSVMQKALIENKVEFVQLFLDSGVKLSKFLTVGRLEDLYRGVLAEIHSDSAIEVIRNLVQDAQKSVYSLCCRATESDEESPVTLTVIGDVLDSLTDFQRNIYEFMDELPKVEDSSTTDTQPATDSLDAARENGASLKYVQEKSLFANDQAAVVEVNDDDAGLNTNMELDDLETKQQIAEETRRSKPVENPERELFFWALLFGRKDLAMLFWRMGRDHIGGALTASRLWKNLAEAADHEEELDLSEELENSSREFEEIAIGVLNQCYQRDKTLAHFLLTRQLDMWADKTLFSIAEDAEQMDFMGHSCCQTQLNKTWTGAMAVNTPMWKIILGLFIVGIPLIKYSKNKSLSMMKKSEDPDAENTREPNSINYYDVSLCGGRHTISLASAVNGFMEAPQIKFCYITIAALCHMALFSYVIIMGLNPLVQPVSFGVPEIVLWVWTLSIFIEEVRQAVMRDSPSIMYKIRSHFDSLWNVVDLVMLLLFIVAVVLRCILNSDNFEWARMMYTLDLSMFFIRFLQVFFVDKNMGPKVIMIRGMLKDLGLFVLILVIFIINYGVASRALMYPNITPSYNMILQPYLMIFGAMDVGEVQGSPSFTCTTNETALALDSTLSPCPQTSWLMVLLFCLQLLIINIMILNLLIAMFSYTFSNIQENSEKVWRYYRYSLIYEYYGKPTLVPPLILLTHVWLLGRFFVRKMCRLQSERSNQLFRILTPEENKKLTAFERTSMENYMLRRQKQIQENIDYKVSSTSDRIEKVVDDLEQLREQFDSHRAAPSSPQQGVHLSMASVREPVSLGSGLNDVAAIKDRLVQQEEMIKQILQMLKSIVPKSEKL